jgi:transcription termination/antitermination protein NusG
MELSHFSFAMGQTEYIPPITSELQLDTDTKWYAIYTNANHEKRVAQQLQRRSVENFLPIYESARRWKDRRVRLQLPLFPGYVFVRMSSRDRLKVLQVPGVAHLVEFGGKPAPVPEEDIQAIRACLAGPHGVQPHRYLKRGQRVTVTSGPLAGLTGIVVRQKKSTRFVISFDLLMRSVAVELNSSDLHAAHV